jgi:riboflavin synthase
MFTGIIEEVGSVERLSPRATGSELRIRATTVMQGTREGDSICVSGVCLTARDLAPSGFSADLSPETLERSGLGQLRPNSLVNLERSLLPTSRMGGHIVQGHVDGLGAVHEIKELGDGNWWLTIEVPGDVERFCVFKGSISIDGVSLTIAKLDGHLLSVAVIPHTYANTTMRGYRKGDRVNLEIDVVAKYVEKMLAARELHPKPKLTEEKLREMGY